MNHCIFDASSGLYITKGKTGNIHAKGKGSVPLETFEVLITKWRGFQRREL